MVADADRRCAATRGDVDTALDIRVMSVTGAPVHRGCECEDVGVSVRPLGLGADVPRPPSVALAVVVIDGAPNVATVPIGATVRPLQGRFS